MAKGIKLELFEPLSSLLLYIRMEAVWRIDSGGWSVPFAIVRARHMIAMSYVMTG